MKASATGDAITIPDASVLRSHDKHQQWRMADTTAAGTSTSGGIGGGLRLGSSLNGHSLPVDQFMEDGHTQSRAAGGPAVRPTSASTTTTTNDATSDGAYRRKSAGTSAAAAASTAAVSSSKQRRCSLRPTLRPMMDAEEEALLYSGGNSTSGGGVESVAAVGSSVVTSRALVGSGLMRWSKAQ